MKTVKNNEKCIFVLFVAFVLVVSCESKAAAPDASVTDSNTAKIIGNTPDVCQPAAAGAIKSVRLQLQMAEPNDLNVHAGQTKTSANRNSTRVQTSDANSRSLHGHGIAVKKKLAHESKTSMQKDADAYKTADDPNKSHVIRCELIKATKPITLTKHRVPIDSNSQIHPVPDINTVSR